jgi:hypothetical protein
MIALVLELCGGALLAFSTIAFLALAWGTKSRPAARPGWELHVDRRGRSVNVSIEKGQGRLDDREPGPVRAVK